MSEIVWGPEIAVDGKRPKWLDMKTPCDIKENFAWFDTRGEMSAEDWCWFPVIAIRLPADHPHYAAQQPRTAPSGGEVGPEVHSFLVPKLTEAQAREWVATNAPGAKADGLLAFLAEHSALLPEPVDPVEAIARRLIDQHDEPWPEGTESDRLHYWRDKAIQAANDLRAHRSKGE